MVYYIYTATAVLAKGSSKGQFQRAVPRGQFLRAAPWADRQLVYIESYFSFLPSSSSLLS
jgi:hypothetical protein